MDNYSNREIDQFFSTQKREHEALQSSIDDLKIIAQRVETQTVKTNGRVNSLENYKWLLIGMGLVITTILIPLIAIVATIKYH